MHRHLLYATHNWNDKWSIWGPIVGENLYNSHEIEKLFQLDIQDKPKPFGNQKTQ